MVSRQEWQEALQALAASFKFMIIPFDPQREY
jgi:hypothetical protein